LFSRSSTADPFQRTSESTLARSNSSQSSRRPALIDSTVAEEPTAAVATATTATWHTPSSSRARRPYHNISTPPRTSSNDSPRTLTLNDRALAGAQIYGLYPDNAANDIAASRPRTNQATATFSTNGPTEDWTQPAPLWTSDPANFQIRDIDMERELEADAQAVAASSSTANGTSSGSSRRSPYQQGSRRAHQQQQQQQQHHHSQQQHLAHQAAAEREYLAYQRTASLAAEQSYVLQQQYHYQQQQLQLQQQQQQQQQQATSSSSSSKSSEPRHRVYLLNCKYCGTFLSNRGQKAVLLLEPHITLYSTDAIPFNCGPLYIPPPVERTCDCITHSLGCYGCGAQVGYHIVAPCSRCTSSVANHRSSNGHRTVLHRSEISVRERRFVPGEPGVAAAPYVPPQSAHVSVQLHGGGAAGADVQISSGSMSTTTMMTTSRNTPSPSAVGPNGPYFGTISSSSTASSSSNAIRTASRTIRSASMAGWSSPPGNSGSSSGGGGANGSGYHAGAQQGQGGARPTDFYAGTYRQSTTTAYGGEADKGAGDGSTAMQLQREIPSHTGISLFSSPPHGSGGQQEASGSGSGSAPTIRINSDGVATSSSGGGNPSYSGSSNSSSNAKPSSGSGSPHSSARVIKRGDVLYWSDLLPEVISSIGERQVPLDPDVVLNQPVAGR